MKSMYEVLKSEKDHRVWWSALFQISAALCVAQQRYGFIHNDLHSENVRVRTVSKKTILYYQTDTGVTLKVPTFGYVFIIIDFGRALLKPWGDSAHTVVSSVFDNPKECAGLICDNPSMDMVRLATSIDDATGILVPTERDKLRRFFKDIAKSDDGTDIFEQMYIVKDAMFKHLIEVLPRKSCHNAKPNTVIPKFYEMFQTEEIPENVKPFQLILKDDRNDK
jgi:hypothetical protein